MTGGAREAQAMKWKMQLREATLTDQQAVHFAMQLLQTKDLDDLAHVSITLVNLFNTQPDIT